MQFFFQVKFEDEGRQRALDNMVRLVVPWFNSKKGYLPWVIASYGSDQTDKVDVAVVSIPITKYILEYCVEPMVSSRHDKIDPKEILDSQWKHMLWSQVPVCFEGDAFSELILQTPFLPSAFADKTLRAKENEKRFFVVRAADWKTFFQSVKSRSSSLDLDGYQEKVFDSFGQTYACVPWTQKPRWLKKELKYNKKMTIPSMGVGWWKELFSEPVQRFFEVKKPVHIVGSEADEEESIISYEKVVLRS